MQAFTDFILTVTYPPNPIRRLNNTLNSQQQEGHDLFFGRLTDMLFNCNGCHTLDPAAGFFGTDGFATFEGETQMFKVPHLRNVYQKVGMFGRPQRSRRRARRCAASASCTTAASTPSSTSSAPSVFSLTNAEQRHLEQFVLAFDSNLAPIVGQQVTLDQHERGSPWRIGINLMIARDTTAQECEVIVKGTIAGEARGGYLTPAGTFQLDRAADAPLADADLRALAATPGQELTYTCVPVRLRACAWASTATRTATSTATSSTPAATRRTRRACPCRPRRSAPPRSGCGTTTTAPVNSTGASCPSSRRR